MAVGEKSRDAQQEIARLAAELAGERAEIAALKAQLSKERARFALAERVARVGYWRMRISDLQMSFSPGMYSILGLGAAPATKSANAVFPWTDSAELSFFRDKILGAVQTRSSFSYRKSLSCPDGSERILDILGAPEFGPDGTIIAVVGASLDVTDRVTAEAERNEAQELYRIMTEAASDIIMVHDGQGNAEFASAALGHILGWTPRDMEGEHLMSLVHPDDIEGVRALRHSVAPGETGTAMYRIRRTDGEYLWFEAKISLVQDEANSKIRTVSVLRDMSERKKQDEALRAACTAADAANLAKSTFLANMSHELRTPLNAIIGFSEVMDHGIFGPVDNPRYSEYVSLIHKSGRHLLDLINDVLDMSKIEAGKFKLFLEDIDVAESIEECVRTMAERADSGNVRLGVVVPTQGLTCSADRRALKQIVLNLLSNAIKFTPPGGHVEIVAADYDDRIHIEVRDDGIGIAAEDISRLGKPFEQVCSDQNLAKSGTGLGLALVRSLIEEHGGNLKIESAEREGTTVTIDFPRSKPSTPEQALRAIAAR